MASPKIHLYLSPGACSLASHILLLETGLPFTITSQTTPDHRAPESFRAINPKMRVPVLFLDDATITETPAIMTAISQLSPQHKLFGTSPMETVRVHEWLAWLAGYLHGLAFGSFLRPERYTDDEAAWPGIHEKGKRVIGECFEKIEGDLKG
ncbi:Glutathione S-transferase GST-6.0, partial [Lachnellula suecica]